MEIDHVGMRGTGNVKSHSRSSLQPASSKLLFYRPNITSKCRIYWLTLNSLCHVLLYVKMCCVILSIDRLKACNKHWVNEAYDCDSRRMGRRENCMRLTKRRRELIPLLKWCISKRALGDLYWGRYWWSSKGDSRWGAGSTCRLNRDKIV